jgi:hypothetical protein
LCRYGCVFVCKEVFFWFNLCHAHVTLWSCWGPAVFRRPMSLSLSHTPRPLYIVYLTMCCTGLPLQMQRKTMEDQDAALDVLLSSLSRTKVIADSIGQELGM